MTRQGQIVLTNRDREIQHELPSKIPLNLFETKQGAVNCRPNQWKRNSRQCKQIEIKDKSVPKMSRESDGPAICLAFLASKLFQVRRKIQNV